MALYHKLPKRLRGEIPENLQRLFGEFNTLCVLKEKRLVEYLAELILPEIHSEAGLLSKTWLKWDDFEKEMSARGFHFNRTTFWSYRKNGHFEDFVKTDGVTTLYQVEGFVEYFSNEGSAVCN